MFFTRRKYEVFFLVLASLFILVAWYAKRDTALVEMLIWVLCGGLFTALCGLLVHSVRARIIIAILTPYLGEEDAKHLPEFPLPVLEEMLERYNNNGLAQAVEQRDSLRVRATEYSTFLAGTNFAKYLLVFKLDEAERLLGYAMNEKAVREADEARKNMRALRRIAETEGLFQEGKTLGLTESRMEETLQVSAGALRALIADERLRQKYCQTIIGRGYQLLFKNDWQATTSAVDLSATLVLIDDLLNSVSDSTARFKVHEYLVAGNMPAAEDCARRARKTEEYEKLKESFRRQISRLDPKHQLSKLQLFESMCAHPFESREFKKARYALESALSKMVA